MWVEITEKAAKKKVGQAFRDITPHDERYRIGAGLPVAEAEQFSSDDDDDDDDERSHQEGDDPFDGAATAAAAAAAAAGYYPEVSNNGTTTTATAASARPAALAHHGRKHSLDDDDDVRKASRLPASEFALYPQGVGGDDSDAKFAGDDNEDNGRQQQQSRRGSTESTDALETLTVELLVERARTWEELYYSERDYSKSLEERLLRLLEEGGRVGPPMPVPMPKRRKVGDTDALAA